MPPVQILRTTGPGLAAALTTVTAVASLAGPNQVRQISGAWWFVAAACLCGILSLAAAVLLLRQRRLAAALLHTGLALGIAGAMLSQTLAGGGYLFLSAGGRARNFSLARNLSRLEELPFSVQLDSLGILHRRGFRPAPSAFVRACAGENGIAGVLTWNRPLTLGGRRLVLSRVVERGFLEEYELVVDETEYLLLHNQRARPRPGVQVASFGFDAAAQQVGLLVNGTRRWLAVGDSATVEGTKLMLAAASFAPAAGAVFVVNDVRFRPVLFIGFGFVLIGLLAPLFRKAGP